MTSPIIGMRLHGGVAPGPCVELAQLADRNGFASLWYAENPFNRGVLPAVVGSIVTTKQLKVGIGVFNPYNRHPTLIAMEMGALDELAGGRAALGIGSGIGDRVERMGLSYDKPLGAVRDAITIVRGMMRGETVTHEGSVFSVKDVRMEYKAPRPDMPILMAAMGDQALRMCGRIADGLMISNMCPPGYTVRALKVMGEAAAKAGRPSPPEIVQYVPCVAGKDRNESRTVAKATIGRMLAEYWRLGARWPAVREAMFRESGIPEAEFVAAVEKITGGAKPADVLDDRFVDAFSIAGNGGDFEAGVARFAAVGVTELVVTFVSTAPAADLAFVGDILRARP